ncbi:autoinducer binding domain-containing protein [Sphingobium sp. BYY-5]|uniref:autoinducer binding domain-containing protein n=1 Tax=Sphingobium sp. BYY-5 TaxID=2926400 RepID=UPI001FA6E5EB|nr:autoinducer binding domain-containing protein [Sphingobium sp. BYY-5]MCI4592170.1 autoinducer binding domain-containing protein [Sphingobium sp. BYY-5]
MTAIAVSDELLAIAEKFGTAQNVDQLCDRFGAAVGEVGDFHYAIGRFRPHMPRDQGVISVHYPEAWQQHYRSNRYIEIDPTIDAITHRNAPYAWDQLSSLDAQRRQLFDDVRDLGIEGGLTVPIHMTGGMTFLASFATHAPDTAQRFRPLLSMVSAQFLEHHTALSGAPEPPVQLTSRERDCLTWTARGKSAWEIGVLLNISENTVNFHIKNACAKLASNGRMLGVVRAIMLGLISP